MIKDLADKRCLLSEPVKPKAFPVDPEMERGGLETEVSVWADANLKLKKME